MEGICILYLTRACIGREGRRGAVQLPTTKYYNLKYNCCWSQGAVVNWVACLAPLCSHVRGKMLQEDKTPSIDDTRLILFTIIILFCSQKEGGSKCLTEFLKAVDRDHHRSFDSDRT